LAIDPKNVHSFDLLLYNIGVALDNLENYTGAVEYYDKALAIDPKNVHSLYNTGFALQIRKPYLYKLGNYTGAIKYYDKALVIQPNGTDALDGKAASLYKLGNYTGAIKYYDKALALKSSNATRLTRNSVDRHTT
jgi:tetratricopeptide (TPR) repeat protein